jgi:hypothetical protein
MTASPKSEFRGPKSFTNHASNSWRWPLRLCLSSGVALVGLMILAGCGSSGSTTTTTTTTTPVANTVTVTVNSGPANTAVNMAYVTVQVCNPGSTTVCATIPNVQVDTGSAGLRILASAPGVSGLTFNPVTGGGSPVDECFQYGGGNYLWGPVVQANVLLAGETAASLPIQVIDSGTAPANVPVNCAAGGGSNLGTSTLLQANGILGVGPTMQDCGSACTGSTVLPIYWLCSSTAGCSSAAVPPATQVSNPVTFFNSDNNGVMLTMGSVQASGATTAAGTLTFGIGTQTDNAITSGVKVYALAGNLIQGSLYYSISAAYNNNTYPALIDSTESYNFFLDAGTLAANSAGAAIVGCQVNTILYCPASAVSLPFTARDQIGDSSTVNLAIGNGDALWSTSAAKGGANAAFSNLAGGYAYGQANDYAILGMPFFYGRTVFVGIAGAVPPSGVSITTDPLGYWAF